ncbi:MAG: hypothetical protein J6C50_02560 [Rickettsiales bacterium]|nr:hypothetical protein [Rickettsiales bacterium]
MLSFILSIFSLAILFKVIIPLILFAIIIFFISQYSGEDPNSIIGILSIGLKNFANYISSCFEYIKNLF